MYVKNIECRVCKDKAPPLVEILNLGNIAIAGAFQYINDSTDETNKLYPFTLGYCEKCGIILCQEIIQPDILFKSGYFYKSSHIPSLVKHFTKYSDDLVAEHGKNKKILEIGCNDGVFLKPLQERGFQVVGVDPATNVTEDFKDLNIPVYNDFVENCYRDIIHDQGYFDIVVSSNCLAHTPNLQEVFKSIKSLLKNDGSLYMEVHYGGAVFMENQFDFLYHEHMTYYTVTAINNIARMMGMHLKNVIFTPIHGKSIRAHIVNRYIPNIPPRISEIINHEKIMNDIKYLQNKAEDFIKYKKSLVELYKRYNNPQKYIQYAYGASGRANTICTFCDMKFDKFIDDSRSKIGLYTPYFNTPIRSRNELYNYETSGITKVLWILAWAYSDYILPQIMDDFHGIIIVPDFTKSNYKIITV